jgi:ribosomal RNA adenine dimethylase
MVNILNNRIDKKEFENISKLSIKSIDVLKFKPEFDEYFVIANIPYYITSPILRHFLYDIKNIPEKMLILMQKDV